MSDTSFFDIALVVGLILAGVIFTFWLFFHSMDIVLDGEWWERVGVFLLWTVIISIAIYFGTRPGTPA